MTSPRAVAAHQRPRPGARPRRGADRPVLPCGPARPHGSGGLSRRIVLTAGQHAGGAAIEVTEGGETFRWAGVSPWPG